MQLPSTGSLRTPGSLASMRGLNGVGKTFRASLTALFPNFYEACFQVPPPPLTVQETRQAASLPRVARLFSSWSAVQIRQLWSGEEPGLTKLASANKLRQR